MCSQPHPLDNPQLEATAALKMLMDLDLYIIAPLATQQDLDAVLDMVTNLGRRMCPTLKVQADGSFFHRVLDSIQWFFVLPPLLQNGKLETPRGRPAITRAYNDLLEKAKTQQISFSDLDPLQPYSVLLTATQHNQLNDWAQQSFRNMGLAEGIGKLAMASETASSSSSKATTASSGQTSVMSFFG